MIAPTQLPERPGTAGDERALRELLAGNEEWLMQRVLSYAIRQGYSRYTSTLAEAWRKSISGLTDTIILALEKNGAVPEMGPDEDYTADPVAAFGILEAQRHRARGISLTMFLGLMKYYRESYVDLVSGADLSAERSSYCRGFIKRVFDRIEIGFCSEWSSLSEGAKLAELQDLNRQMTNEKNKYLTVFESIHDPAILMNAQNSIVNMNHAASEFFVGRGVPGHLYYGGGAPETLLPLIVDKLPAFATGDSSESSIEVDLPTANGPRHFLIKLKKMLDVSEKFSGTIVLMSDETETVQAREALKRSHEELEQLVEDRTAELQESEERYRRLLSSVTDYIYTVHVADGLACSSVHGPGCRAVTGYAPEDYDADHLLWYRMIAEPDRDAAMEQIRRLLSGEAVMPLEHRIIHKDGSVRWIRNVFVRRFDGTGKMIGYDGLVRDITETKRLEEQLRQAQKMEAVGHLAGGVAHDFNNILTAIVGYANLLQMRMRPDDLLRSYVDQILLSSERASMLTQSLLTFSRKQVINPRPVDVNAIVRSIDKFIGRLIGDDIELKIVLADEPMTVVADSLQLEQILMNLCTNARDAMPEGGTITISTELVQGSGNGEGPGGCGQAVITVADTGHGMDDATRERIFEHFFTTKDAGKGSGLGLAIVYGIVKQHRGEISVRSEAGRGSVFTVKLPLVKAKAGHANLRPAETLCRGSETILIAEDDPNTRALLRNVFEYAGYNVIEAADGEEALARCLERQDLGLVLSDVIMPKMNGGDLCEKLRTGAPQVKVILMSGYTNDEVRIRGFITEGIPFIQKPVHPMELLKLAREALDA